MMMAMPRRGEVRRGAVCTQREHDGGVRGAASQVGQHRRESGRAGNGGYSADGDRALPLRLPILRCRTRGWYARAMHAEVVV